MPALVTRYRLACTLVCSASIGVIASLGAQSAVGAQSRPPVTFNHDVAPILYANCATLPSPRRIGALQPADLRRRESTRRLIAAVTTSHVMPPWQPESAEGEFEGERRLRARRRSSTLRRWVEDGLLEGDPAERPAGAGVPERLAARHARSRRHHAGAVRRAGGRARCVPQLRAADSADRAALRAGARVPSGQRARPASRAHPARRHR